MADILQNQIKQDEPLIPTEPSLKGPSEQTYLDSSGRLYGSATGNIIYASTTQVTANTSGSTTLATFTLPGGTLKTSNVVRMRLLFSDIDWDTTDSSTLDVILNNNLLLALGNGTRCAKGAQPDVTGYCDIVLYADGTEFNQKLHATMHVSQSGNNSAALLQASGVSVNNALTEDSRNDIAVKIRWTWATRNAPSSATLYSIIVEKIA